ncbi:MAG: Maf family nucleotide pyrophosphatase [Burkholderiales bacterium]|nr:Maf family nucleotide pyrophosphatase [Burkholderiales bacterium]
MNSPRLILASTSIYRRALLERLRLPFEVFAPDVDETALPAEPPAHTALRLADLKAEAAAPATGRPVLIIGSDQVAVLDAQPLGKPGDHLSAVRQLQAMRGKSVVFNTAICLFNPATGRKQLENVPTTVWFRDYSDDQIEHYLRTEQPYDCAGSAKIEGMGIALVERIDSTDPTALIGLPLMRLTTMLKNEGIEVIPRS